MDRTRLHDPTGDASVDSGGVTFNYPVLMGDASMYPPVDVTHIYPLV